MRRWKIALTGLSLVLTGLCAGFTGELAAGGPRLPSAPRWRLPITYRLDPGPLASGVVALSHEEGAQLVAEAFATWTGVPTSDLQIVNGGNLAVDVTDSNFAQFTRPGNGNAVVFDADGRIIQSMLGMNTGGTVLGFATALDTDADGFQDFGFAVLNGTAANTRAGSGFRATVGHELAHLVGLDHTQAGAEAFSACSDVNPDACLAIPIMYPFIRGGVSVPLNTAPLTDDRAWISWLYPATNFGAVTGRIQGQVRRRQGVPFQGVHVVAARLEQSPAGAVTDSRTDRVSAVTDFAGTLEGRFELPGLPPGDYWVRIEALQGGFTEGSGVGPFDVRFTDFASPDYYNGSSESGTEGGSVPRDDRSMVSVAANQVVSGIDFVSDDNSDALPGSDLATLGDDDSRTLFFPEGFRFPFFGATYRAVYVNSDGNLSFEGGQSFSNRSEAEFLGGPPRIAPLFTDLDPSAGGRVRAAMADGGFTITWDQVPEFSSAGARPPNTFSVTLFGNGDIRFRYGNIQVLPDAGLQAVVGVTPGRTPGEDPLDLSSQNLPLRFLDGPVYQTFSGSSFDLNNRDLLFQAATNDFFLYFPLVQADGDRFTGVAVSNDAAEAALLVVEALSDEGQRQDLPENPGNARLEPGRQLARLSTEFFGLQVRQPQSGWMRIGSNVQQLSSFFQVGNGLTGPTTRLDGSVAFSSPANLLYFTRLFDGPGSFPTVNSPRDATTLLVLANPGSTAVTATLSLFGPMGGDPISQAVRSLPAGGCLRERLDSLFAVGPLSVGLVRVDVTGSGAIGFELIQVGDTLLGLNASLGNPESRAFSAQLAHGETGGNRIFTSLKIINAASSLRAVTVTATDEQGAVIGVVGPFAMLPNSSLQRDVGALFGLGPPIGPAVAGSLRVDADGPGIIGDVVFGDPDAARYAAALPLQSSLFRRAIFSQVANRQAASAAASTFTGLAFHNPNPQPALITIRVFRQGGALTAETEFELAAGGRLSEVLSVLVAASAGQERGFIEVVSDQPLVAQQLFGNLTLDFLSAVPPSLAIP